MRARNNLVCGLVAALLSLSGLANAQVVGEVLATSGVATVQPRTGGTQVAGKGTVLAEGDRISTGERSVVQVKLTDGTQMTVRPSSQLTLTAVKYNQAKPEESSLILSLLKGGLRAVTGLISKTSPNAAQVRTTTATIGIRGTDFDARLCDRDCRAQGSGSATASAAGTGASAGLAVQNNRLLAAARVVQLNGPIVAVDANGTKRNVYDGGPVYPGDTVTTTVGYAVLAFRDESRITLAPNSQFKVTDFVYSPSAPQEGRVLVDLVKGGLRFLTGLVGKTKPNNVTFRTTTATVGIRGTACDMLEEEVGTRVQCSQGMVRVKVGDKEFELGVGNCLSHDKYSACQVLFQGVPAPGDVQVDFLKLFGVTAADENVDGLYVVVREGHIQLQRDGKLIDLAAGETGYTDGALFIRPVSVPMFLINDPTPRPGQSIPSSITSLLDNSGLSNQNVCR
jgi:hypothetical protein